MSNKIFLSCDDAGHTCDKTQYKEATFWEKIKLNIHLVYCAACRKYTKNNTKLTQLISQKPIKLEPQAKEKLQATFEKELANHDH